VAYLKIHYRSEIDLIDQKYLNDLNTRSKNIFLIVYVDGKVFARVNEDKF
jgi:hypothetical protein